MTDSSQSQIQKDGEIKSQIQNISDVNSSYKSEKSAIRNTIENIQNLRQLRETIELKSKLTEFKDPLILFDDENKALNKIYENEDKMVNEINDKDKAFRLNDFIFEEKVVKIFSDFYGLKEYNLYPHFDIGLSEKKRTNLTSIFYYKIDFQIDGKKESNEPNKKKSSNKKKTETKNETDEKSQSKSMYFLDDRKAYMAKFQEIPMIFLKENGIFNYVRVISQEQDFFIDFSFKKSGQGYEAFIPFSKIKEDLIKIRKSIIEAENIRDTTNNSQEKEIAEKNLIVFNEILDSLQTKYSENTIKTTLKEKKNELSQLEKDKKLDPKEKEQSKQRLLNEIKEQEELLKGITVKITRINQEFDGLFFTTKEITLKNTIEDILTIPAKKPVIVEAKNISNYKSILNNIKDKKRLLQALGLDATKFYFVGILRGIDVDKTGKENAIKLVKYLDTKNLIIIYPDEWNFLGFPLYKSKKEIIEKDETKNDGETSLQEENTVNKNIGNEPSNDVLQKILKKLGELDQKVMELKVDMDKVKKKINID